MWCCGRTKERTEKGSVKIEQNAVKYSLVEYHRWQEMREINEVVYKRRMWETIRMRWTNEEKEKLEKRWSKIGWSRASMAAEWSRRQRQHTWWWDIAFDRWLCSKSSVVSVQKFLVQGDWNGFIDLRLNGERWHLRDDHAVREVWFRYSNLLCKPIGRGLLTCAFLKNR